MRCLCKKGSAMIVFQNTVYGPGHWGVIYLFHHLGTVDFVASDTLSVTGSIDAIGDTVNVDYQGGTYPFIVSAYDSDNSIVLEFSGNYYVLSNSPLSVGQVISMTTDGPGDYAPPPCFVAGTAILTRHGEVPVEALHIGDQVAAVVSGKLTSVVWMGRRTVDCTQARHPAELWPFRIRAHAFGPGRPHRDLFLSPDHAVHVEGVLIPIRHLENGCTIVREPRDTVTYFHVELERHDVMLTEGLGTESYLDTGNRDDFVGLNRDPATAEEHAAASQQIWADHGCAPLLTSGPSVRTARAKLAARATALGHRATDDPGLVVRVGGTSHSPVRDGWSWHFNLPASSERARLVSTSFVPATLQPGSADRRCLGVPVTRMMADGRIVPLHHPALGRGWHLPEDGLRWTAGAAELPPLRHLSVVLAPIGRTQAHPRLLPAA